MEADKFRVNFTFPGNIFDRNIFFVGFYSAGLKQLPGRDVTMFIYRVAQQGAATYQR